MNNSNYIQLIGLHFIIGFLIFFFKPLSYVYTHLIIFGGIIWVLRNKNANEEALLVAAYIAGSELLIRMTKGYFFWEYAKYSIIIVLFIGMYFKGFARNALPYWIFSLLLLPGIIIGMIEFGSDPRLRQSILFNISGPICLFVGSLYCYTRAISLKKFMKVLLIVALPIISCVVYAFLYTPDLREALVHTGSNFATSGGYGPNQVATFLGLGMFVFFTRALFSSPTRLQFLINLALSLVLAYRALLTFSRGGLITGLFMIVLFLGIVFFKGGTNVRSKLSMVMVLLGIGMFFIWIYTIAITGGLIEKRYKNQDAQGRAKSSVLSGREEVAMSEIQLFLDEPFLGGGVGSGHKYREEHFDISIASHNEVTRMLGEHGFFGIIGLLLLIITPLILYLDNKSHFFLLSLLAFWFLTLNHAAMRTALPAFIYALTLLKIHIHEIPIVYWKQTLQARQQSLNDRNVEPATTTGGV
ncbi:O-antigen ligase family protein [Flavobacterium orientale]|uniref:Ligase n=1 Tax=Flavobacterium orientale TaxID=1756020 RepID=A0A916XVF1_9FLAO|nr:O-antigen ligase family protein [Flavobacterium orientale]GGD15109.1 ligase [Flavobacterium orientale]